MGRLQRPADRRAATALARRCAGVISLCSTDDRYADDVHYIGGCLLASDMLSWSATMLAFNARPPDPDVVGERWRSVWRERLERTAPYIHRWLSHQRRDAYWRHGSICENYDAIECPVYLVGGWADAHRDAILRMVSELSCPRKGLIGPWAHLFPHTAVPGPRVGFLQECLRWWDYWLKGIETKVMDEPMLRVWMQEWVEPGPVLREATRAMGRRGVLAVAADPAATVVLERGWSRVHPGSRTGT